MRSFSLIAPLGLALAALGAHVRPASAGTFATVGVGGGKLGCTTDRGDDCGGDSPLSATSFTGELGFSFGHRLALMGMISVAARDDDESTVSQSVLALAARGWLVGGLWVEGGLGAARATVDVMRDDVRVIGRSETAPAVVGAIGIDLIRTPALAFDVNLRFAKGLYDDGEIAVYQAMLGVGMSFY
jgi:hypothetical protein